ncbi:GNAT family N-acetyltransferase [Pseudovibrio sp. Tun.PSC04-5.I4]|uniref:GNAT family N-acetyltransferase n=1 Tax=Pseudovibrio sp. Tun.PSC04-5.I4 TaxID=1798213 RepID=UPI00087E4E96|nr:GNAT family N-acetyltransferase [Pseudovibrio sp. Tun.PSC04-5.I4]SDQ72116.1 Acetyltransferase (GNAT) family protein [Pseudovibrio sp. Tun.PSC04-5.I4]
MKNHRWSLMNETDLPVVEQIMLATYPHLLEDISSIRERIRLFPEGSRILRRSVDDVIVGYFISHPWAAHSIPPLSSLLGELPTKAEVYYIHDIALMPDAQGIGAARAILADMSQIARNLHINRFALVALASALAFWTTQGFREIHEDAFKEKLRTYGPGAQYMQRAVD